MPGCTRLRHAQTPEMVFFLFPKNYQRALVFCPSSRRFLLTSSRPIFVRDDVVCSLFFCLFYPPALFIRCLRWTPCLLGWKGVASSVGPALSGCSSSPLSRYVLDAVAAHPPPPPNLRVCGPACVEGFMWACLLLVYYTLAEKA